MRLELKHLGQTKLVIVENHQSKTEVCSRRVATAVSVVNTSLDCCRLFGIIPLWKRISNAAIDLQILKPVAGPQDTSMTSCFARAKMGYVTSEIKEDEQALTYIYAFCSNLSQDVDEIGRLESGTRRDEGSD